MKRRLIYNFLTLLLLNGYGLVQTQNLYGQKASKEVKKEFAVDQWSVLDIRNKHGDVHIITWDRSIVSLEVSITLTTGNQVNAEKTLRKTAIYYQQVDNRIYTHPQLVEPQKPWWKFWQSSGYSYQVDYHVKIPRELHLEIELTHGSIVIDRYQGNLKLDLKFGKIIAQDFVGKVDVDITQGEAEFGKINQFNADLAHTQLSIANLVIGQIESRHSKIKLGEVGNLNVYSSYDDYIVKKVEKLVNEGAYDDIKIGQANELLVQSQFTTMAVDRIFDQLSLEVAYGDYSVNELDTDFKEINIDARHADILIFSISNMLLSLEATNSQIDLPERMMIHNITEEGSSMNLMGSIGLRKGKIACKIFHGSLQMTINENEHLLFKNR